MLISDSHRFIFVHIPKTGGTSISDTLAPYLNHKVNIRHPHHQAREHALAVIRGLDYPCFTVFRNPWSRFLSMHYRATHNPRYGAPPNMKLSEFVGWFRQARVRKLGFMHPQTKHLRVDDTSWWLKFEELERCFETFCRLVGLPKLKLAHHKRRLSLGDKHTNWQPRYDKHTKDAVARLFKDDIDMLGATFDGEMTEWKEPV